MATFTIANDTNITSLTGKTGNDTYNINEGHLVIDCDSRYGLNQFTSSALGGIVISPTLGGKLTLRSTNVRLIKYINGTGNVPSSGTIISKDGVSAEILCVMKSSWGEVIYPANNTLPQTGYIKVRNITGGSFTPGLLNSIAAHVESTDIPGWIMLVGIVDKTFSVPRMGEMNVEGNWFYLENTTGIRGQTIQLPHILATNETHYPLIEIETSPGSNEFEPYKNVGIKFTSAIQSLDSRCKNIYISTTGLVTIGLGTDGLPAGFLPPANCRVRIPGIILQNAASATMTINSTPTNVLGARYESQFTSAGTLKHNISTGVWYWNLIQSFSVNITNLHTAEQFSIAECAQPLIIDRLFVGLSTINTVYAGSSISFTQCFNGGQIGYIDGIRSEGASGSAYSVSFNTLSGTWLFDKIKAFYASNPTVISGCVIISGSSDITINSLYGVGKRVLIFSSSNIILKELIKADNVSGTTLTTLSSRAIEITNYSNECEIYNIKEWPDAINTHPYDALVAIQSSKNIKVRNIGNSASPYNAGTINAVGYVYSDIGSNENINIQRCWLNNLRLNIYISNNSSTKTKIENCYNNDATKNHAPQFHNSLVRGNRQNNNTVLYGYTSVYGTHFWDSFLGDTTSRFAIIFVEETPYSSGSYVIDAGTPIFTAQGELAMATTGDSITWTTPNFILGWDGFTTWGISGTNQLTNHSYEYDVDKGNGFSNIFKNLTNANLLAESNINPSIGFRLRIKITCTSSSINNKIRSFFIDGTTSLSLQNNALYPLDIVKLKLTNVSPQSSIAIFEENITNGKEYILYAENNSNEIELSYPHNPFINNYTVRVRKPGFVPVDLVYQNKLNITIPVFQIKNTDGFGSDIYGRGPGTTSAFISVDENYLRIDISNIRCIAEDVYDYLALWQCSQLGIRYPEALRFDGVDLLILNDWKFRRKDPLFLDAGIDALPVVDGSPNGSPDDESNGSVDFRARSVRTWKNEESQITADDIANAVWGFSQSNGVTAQTNLLTTKLAAQNAFAASISR